ncbi:zinc finger protein 578-like [Microplitis mediator]|uniref:zinc finger protein 578-like n=1 Tax=Microplitis mediator TaxID=375433 RepID=UPI0025538EA6|nr:zinc finger protein 578-like [Microplitis mediator]
MHPRDVIELSDNESEFSGSIALFQIADDPSDSSVFGDAERDDTFAVPRRVSSKAKSSRKRNNFMKNVSRNPSVHVKVPTQVNGVASNASHVPNNINSRNPLKNIKILLDKISISKQEENSFSKDPNTYDKFSSSSKPPDKYLPYVLLERVSVPDKNFKSSQEQPDDQQSKDDDKNINTSHQDPQLRNLPFVLLERISAPVKRVNTRADNIVLRKIARKSSNPTINSRRHELSASIPDKEHKCDHCDYATDFEWYFRRHMKSHSGGPLLKCTDCDFETLYSENLKTHKRRLHARKSLPVGNIKKTHKCDHCNYGTNVATNFDRHMKKHFGGPLLKCTYCDFETLYSDNLKRHERRLHARKSLPVGNIKNKHKCDHCNYGTNITANFHRHMKTHVGGPLLKCTDCDFETVHSDSLKRHERLHARKSLPVGNLHGEPESVVGKKHKCDHCNFGTNIAASLSRHMKTHFGGPLFKCTDCNFETLRSDNLEKHKLRHVCEPFTCPYCPFTAFEIRALNVHIRSHPVANQLECNICHLKFARLNNLTIHRLRYHTSCVTTVSKLTCSFCQKVFADKYSLMIHKKTYKSGNDYKCKKCSYTTRESRLFKNHLTKHLNK